MQSWFRSRFAVVGALLVAVGLFGPLGAVSALAAPEHPNQVGSTSKNTGYDISYPQCSSSLPAHPGFGIVGVNDGRAYTANPCLVTEYTWATGATSSTEPHVSFYANTGNPGPTASTHWPAAGATAPQYCDGSWSTGCAYDYGYFAAQDSFRDAVNAVGATAAQAAPWWLDVETANSWSSVTATNNSDLQGAVAGLNAMGVSSVGIYSTSSMWNQITGATAASSATNDPFRTLYEWIPGAHNANMAPQLCSQTFAGGRVKFVQYPSGSFDGDYACF